MHAEEADLMATRARHAATVDNIRREIDKYETQKTRLRALIEHERAAAERLQNGDDENAQVILGYFVC